MVAMAHSQEPPEPHKRKRDADDSGGPLAHSDRIPQPPPPQSGSSGLINYLSKASSVRLKLIQGDGETFSDVLGLISEYEGVLNRHESLAANLGAKLTGPRLLKAMEGMFEGPIITSPPQTPYTPNPVGWVDIVQYAKSNPNDFNLVPTLERERVCQFSLKGVQVEITEDDWRLIMSGALDGFRIGSSAQPLEEDESAELATVEIVEGRLQVLIKKADEVARRARQLNYQLSGRKAAINARHQPQQGQGPGFQAVNQPTRGGGPGGYDLQADLLQQFLAQPQTSHSRASSMAAVSQSSVGYTGPPSKTPVQQRTVAPSSRPSPAQPQEMVQRDGPSADDPSSAHRSLITARVEKLARGDVVYPACDRCRRLKTQCVKHLTACQGCTKKHAKCSWRTVTEEELAWLKKEMMAGEGEPEPDTDELGESRSVAQEDTITDELAAAGSRPSSRGDYRARPTSEAELGARMRSETYMEVDSDSRARREREAREQPSAAGGSSLMVGGHSLLSHMATVATARAEARDAGNTTSHSSQR